MTTPDFPPLSIITSAPEDVLARLPQVGRLMLINSALGVTHERIGTLSEVLRDGDTVTAQGPDHDAVITLSAITRMEMDRRPVMREKPYPRVNFYGADGAVLFSAVSFAGLEPFDAALAGLTCEAIEAEGAGEAFARGEEAATDDPGLRPLQQALDSGASTTVAITRDGYRQQWRGIVETIKPSMGFINILLDNFHFHLKGGAVADWRDESVADGRRFVALNTSGAEIGLQVTLHDQPA